MTGLPFIKMHGLGNDFVVVDARKRAVTLSAEAARAIADRRRGVGCDQLIVLEAPREAGTQAFMKIRNADGGESAACGNATRCVGAFLMSESGASEARIGTEAGILTAQRGSGAKVIVDFGAPRLGWREVPLAKDCDTLHAPISEGPLKDPACCSMGNPHGTFFVADAEAVDLPAHGPKLEHHPMFPERANIGVAQVIAPDRIRLRVWERGAGITLACGTGACAALVNASRRGVAARKATVILDGGELTIEWREADGHVLMTGAAAISFTGELDPSLASAS
ncbi:MAG TPA: diaminopimelate epimerase [Alphaproteobacteria bacterium]|nr:diaminopimelate epimerase [Alphaproteobacteria bacterium]